jgi:tetrahydromethanopterin S-methyltransferase subunit G
MKLEDIEKRLQELPTIMEQLKAEQNQLLGYKQALLDIEEKSKEKKK